MKEKTAIEQYRTVPKYYFDIEAGYVWGAGMSRERLEAFHRETNGLFEEAGWTVVDGAMDYSCPTAVKGDSRLYLHPMDFSGACADELVEEVKDIIGRCSCASLRAVRKVDFYYIVDDRDDEIRLWHLMHDGDIEAIIHANTVTKRCNLWKSESQVASSLRSALSIRTNLSDGVFTGDDSGYTYIRSWFEKLRSSGLFRGDNGYIRWASRKELKQLGL